MTSIRHINRGDIKEGGCPMCKPRHKREDDIMPIKLQIEEGLVDADDPPHIHEDDWTFDV